MTMDEIEVKLKYKNKKAVISALKKSGFIYRKTRTIKDIYFSKDGISMSNKNRLIRVRNVKGEYAELTLKDRLRDTKGVWTRRELNVKILEAEKMSDLLLALGYKKIKKNLSVREIWKKKQTKVEFISYIAPAKLEFMEIESDRDNNINKLVEYLGNTVTCSGEELFAVFDKITS